MTRRGCLSWEKFKHGGVDTAASADDFAPGCVQKRKQDSGKSCGNTCVSVCTLSRSEDTQIDLKKTTVLTFSHWTHRVNITLA